ncbi:MAG: histidine kinase [Verrucomicrobia bacterium]|nr:histidine kinase [Verrucomicrobiota bacterium]MBV8278160.1 histidine kinase [Verrucomicrobiota bacterium]
MSDPAVLITQIIIGKICVLVTTAFLLTLAPAFRSDRSRLSFRDRGAALLVFLALGLVEEATVRQTVGFNHRIVAACAAGLLAGPMVGLTVAGFVTWLAVTYDGYPFVSVGISMLCAGLVGGWVHLRRPALASHPLTGFGLTFFVTLVREGLIFCWPTLSPATPVSLGHLLLAPVLQGLGTMLVLAVMAQVREHDEQVRAAASAEVRALQARMNPHFLFNALNSLAALATISPREVPAAAGRLRHFLRASFDQQDRTLVPVAEELAVVRAYLDIEALRFGNRLKVEQLIDPAANETVIPPFSLQPLVENAVRHGIQSSAGAGKLKLIVRPVDRWLEMTVTDDGKGVPAGDVEKVFFEQRPRAHALLLLRRRLQELFGHSFSFAVYSDVGRGTTVTVRIPLQPPFEVVGRSLEQFVTEDGELAPG